MISELYILAGGKGSRLGELCNDTPKPMLIVQEIPFLEVIIKFYSDKDIKKIIILAGYLGEQIYYKYNRKFLNGILIEVIVEHKPLGTLGCIVNVIQNANSEFLVVNGDTFIDYDFNKLFSSWRNKRDRVNSMILVDNIDNKDKLRMKNEVGFISIYDDIVVKFNEKNYLYSNTNILLYNLGVYVFEKITFDNFIHRKGDFMSLEVDFFGNACQEKTVGYCIADAKKFIDIGTVDSYKFVQSWDKF